MSKYDDLKAQTAKKRSNKKATKKKKVATPRKKPAGQKGRAAGGLNATVPDNSTAVAKIASELEVRQFVRLWAQCGWDILHAVAQMHPELKPSELKPVAEAYRTSRHFSPAMEGVLQETSDRTLLDQPSAEEILSRYATTSPLDFLGDDGKVSAIADLRCLPRHAQLALKKLKVSVTDMYDKEGEHYATHTQTEIELHDSLKAIQQLSRMKGWGLTEEEENWAKMLTAAENRLQSRVIDLDEIDPED